MSEYIEVDGLRVGPHMVRAYLESLTTLEDAVDSQKAELSRLREQNAELSERLRSMVDQFEGTANTFKKRAALIKARSTLDESGTGWNELDLCRESLREYMEVCSTQNYKVRDLADALLVHIDRKTCPDCERFVVDGEPHDDTCRYAPVVAEARAMFEGGEE